MRWVPVQGAWPRLVAWACRHRVPGAQGYAAGKIREEREVDQGVDLLTACLKSGKPVHAFRDEDGRVVIRVVEEER